MAKGWFRPHLSWSLSFDLILLTVKKVKAPISNLKRTFHGSFFALLRTLPPLRKQLSSSCFWTNSFTCSSHFWKEYLNRNQTTDFKNTRCNSKHPFRQERNGPLFVARWKNPTSFPRLFRGWISKKTPISMQWTFETSRRKDGVSCFNKRWIGVHKFP